MADEATRQELLAALRQHEAEADWIRDSRMALLERLQVVTAEITRLHRHVGALDREERSA
jgi:hypothetical protein